MNNIDIQHITFGYNQKFIFNDLSLTFNEGEFCAVVGPNGSGKTTLLKCMAGLLPLSKGEIFVGGRSIRSCSEVDSAKMIAYVPQRQDNIFDVSVYDTVMMGRNPYQKHWQMADRHDEEVVCEMLEKCRLLSLKDRMLSELSGGELQRTLIARAMAQQTPIILLDEPLSNLDIAHKFEIMDILRELNTVQHILVIIIIHDFPIALQYARHALLVKDGKLVCKGEASAVLSPENIRNCFELGPEFEILKAGYISKN